MTSSSYPDSDGFATSNHSGWSPTTSPGLSAGRRPVPVRSGTTRAPQRRSLTDDAHVWLARLPPRYQPLATARRHPHIVNRLAALWALPAELPAYFQELMLSRRAGRQGFAFEVLTELADLQSWVEQQGPAPH